MKKLMRVFSVCLVLLLTVCVNVSALGSMDYVVAADGKEVSIPQTHLATKMIRDLGDKGGLLSEPSDIFVDSNDNIYIADSGNNRVVMLDKNGKYLNSFDCGGGLSSPSGVFVSKNGDIYVADTLNERIVHLSQQGESIEEFVKPQSELLDEDTTFQVSRIGITEQGYLYTIRGQYFMMIDANNEFKGYVGDNRLGFSLTRLLIRTFASKEQQAQLIKDSAASYYSFDIGSDGLIYATTGEDSTTNQIQKINIVGKNIFPQKTYGQQYFNKEINRYVNPRFVDICVDLNGVIYVIDAYSCNIFVYDQEGNMLAVFGGQGQVKGKFNQPVAIDTLSNGDVLVLDQATGYIHWFERSSFMNNITDAVDCYKDGKYVEAEAAWKQVLDVNANYPVANKGIADALYKQGNIEEAMKYYKLSDSKSGYGTAFSVFQYDYFRAHFGLVVILVVVIVIALIFVIIFLKKRADKLVNDYYSGGKTNDKD